MEQFLIERLGVDEGKRIHNLVRIRLKELKRHVAKRSFIKTRVLKGMLLLYVAFYRILMEEEFSEEDAKKLIEEYMLSVDAAKLKRRYDMMDRFSCAYTLFRTGFVNVVAHADLWDADIDTSHKEKFSVTIRKCFWNDIFREYNCPDICRYA